MDIKLISLLRIVVSGIVLFATIQPAKADFIGIYAGAGGWQHTTSGHINNAGTDSKFDKDMGLDEDLSGFTYVAVEHPFPLIPNIRINTLSLKAKSDNPFTVVNNFTFAGTGYTAGQTILTELTWKEADSLLYYEFLDNIVSFDLGLGMRKIQADLSITSGGTTNILKIEESLPIAYMMVGAHIPGTGISFIVEQTQSFLGDIQINQNSTKIAYETSFLLGIELGYRTQTANLDDLPNITGEVEFSGPFANLLIHF